MNSGECLIFDVEMADCLYFSSPCFWLKAFYARFKMPVRYTAVFLFITRYKLLFDDWRGYLIALFSLVWVANVYMALFGRVRLDLKKEHVEITTKEAALSKDK